MKRKLFTSESVTEGHPDKLCDKISDAVLDEFLKQDSMSRVACETVCTTGLVMVTGEVTSGAYVDIQGIVRNTIKEIGYDQADYGFSADSCGIINSIHEQSPDIAMGVDKSYEAKNGTDDDKYDIGAGDQGMMFGYACRETAELMPLPISLSHKAAKKLTEVRKSGVLDYLRPDGKTQFTVEYDNGIPVHIDTVVVSTQHSPDVSIETIRNDVIEYVIKPVAPSEMFDENTKIYVNPTGRFVVGGPNGDSGLTGRKIIVDTYGGYARHGGGAFSGKDPTKVDRSASYAARYVAKNIVASGVAEKCEVQIAYAIGVARPVSILIDSFGTSLVDEDRLSQYIRETVDLRPAAIIEKLELRNPIYKELAAYGHMGREDLGVAWERCDIADRIKADLL